MQKVFKFLNRLYPIFLLIILFIGFFLRTKAYLINQSFWHDECALAWNIINRSYKELFQPLRFLQSAPILFLIITKYLVEVFGKNEIVFRFIPYLSSILSLAGFYFLSKKTLKTNLSIIFANLLFAVNLPLYYYSSEFKPYSTDVLFCILSCLLFISLNKKVLILYSLILSSFIWFSFPAVFLLSAILFLVIFNKNYSIKEKIIYIIPHIVSGLLFCVTFFTKMFQFQKTGMISYWQNEFISIKNIHTIFQQAFNFMFNESLITIILSIIGLFIFIKNKEKFGTLTFTILSTVIIISSLHLYPFSGRLILFLIPIIILLITKTFDSKKAKSLFFLGLCILSIYPQFSNTFNTIIKNNYNKNNPNPREMAKYLKNQINKEDIIYINTASNSDYLYYKQIYNINNKYFIETPQYIQKNNKVWFFLPNNANDTFETIIKNNYIILYENKRKDNLLIYAEKLK